MRSLSQCIAVCGSVLQYIVVYCSVLQFGAVRCIFFWWNSYLHAPTQWIEDWKSLRAHSSDHVFQRLRVRDLFIRVCSGVRMYMSIYVYIYIYVYVYKEFACTAPTMCSSVCVYVTHSYVCVQVSACTRL